jgi:hypothetical protein
MSTYEGEHTIFGLLSLADLTQNDVIVYFISVVFLFGVGNAGLMLGVGRGHWDDSEIFTTC